jgi:hypothetical protein
MLVGCGSGASKTPHQAAALVSIAGEVGTLPAPGRTTARAAQEDAHGPRPVPARLGRALYIPFRNDGREPLVVRRIERPAGVIEVHVPADVLSTELPAA